MVIDYLIVGLGNPGKRYENTRHNIGWMVAENFIEKRKGEINNSHIYKYSHIEYSRKNVIVAMPTTYMNLSGEAVLKLKHKYSVSNDRIIVIVDEYNFPTGKIHLRKGGSDGGHNGVTSVIEELGSADFYRLRCGIDRKFGAGELVDYVLKPFPDEENDLLKLMIEKSVLSLEMLIKDGIPRTMNNINNENFWELKFNKKVEKNENNNSNLNNGVDNE